MTQLLFTVNPCYPRSGHRFLRSICSDYFGNAMTSTNTKKLADRPNANYVKDHDKGISKGNAGRALSTNEQYLVQYRHPLESIQSFFEFQVHHGRSEDTAEAWAAFLPEALDYWKAFVTKWCLDTERLSGHRIHRVSYGDLYTDTKANAEKIVSFMTGGQEPIDDARLTQAVEKNTGGFARYMSEQRAGERTVSKVRDIRDFKYFDETLYELEDSITAEYLQPLGLKRVVTSD